MLRLKFYSTISVSLIKSEVKIVNWVRQNLNYISFKKRHFKGVCFGLISALSMLVARHTSNPFKPIPNFGDGCDLSSASFVKCPKQN